MHLRNQSLINGSLVRTAAEIAEVKHSREKPGAGSLILNRATDTKTLVPPCDTDICEIGKPLVGIGHLCCGCVR